MSSPPPAFTLDQLAVLEAIEATGSFAAAARTLGRVPSAVSYSIKTLEDTLGVAIFDRAKRRAALTPAGQRLLEEARLVLGQARRLEQVAQTLHDGWEPSVSLVVDGVYPTAPVMRALRAFNAHGAPTRVLIHVEYQSGVAARFARDQADLMLMLEFDGTGAQQAVPLPPLELLLVAAPDHPLATGPVTRADLQRHVELVVRDSAPEFMETPREAWFGSRHVAYLSDFHGKLIAIRSGAGYGWLPTWLARPWLDRGELRQIGFDEGNRWTYRPHIIWRRDVPLGRAGRLFLAALQAAIAESAAEFE